jgi:hypothetical protein
LSNRVFRPRPVVDRLEIENPVADTDNREQDQDVVHHPHQLGFGLVEQKHQHIGDDDVNTPVVLGGCRLDHGSIRVKQHQQYRKGIEDNLFESLELIVHGGP